MYPIWGHYNFLGQLSTHRKCVRYWICSLQCVGCNIKEMNIIPASSLHIIPLLNTEIRFSSKAYMLFSTRCSIIPAKIRSKRASRIQRYFGVVDFANQDPEFRFCRTGLTPPYEAILVILSPLDEDLLITNKMWKLIWASFSRKENFILNSFFGITIEDKFWYDCSRRIPFCYFVHQSCSWRWPK